MYGRMCVRACACVRRVPREPRHPGTALACAGGIRYAEVGFPDEHGQPPIGIAT
eukprot:COSAG01_NODE_5203_length_4414_cov_3.702897_2_plen_54_part_00